MRDQVREEVSFTDGKVIVQGQLHTRGKRKRADYILYYKPSQPLAIIEAKDNNHNVGDGMQQALEYAMRGRTTLQIAHRLSTLSNSSKIAVLDGGKVAESGGRDALLEKNGLFAALHSHQKLCG